MDTSDKITLGKIREAAAGIDAAEKHPEYDAAVAIVASLLDIPAFQDAWGSMCQVHRADMLWTIAEGIGDRIEAEKRRVLLKIAAQI